MKDNKTEFAILTKQLEERAKEYEILCEKLEKLKELQKFDKTQQLENLKLEFSKNLNDIREIKAKLKMLSED